MLLDPLQARILLNHALENRYAILAVNADSHAAVTDCLEAALQVDAPVIIETSLWQLEGHSFGSGDAITGVARYLADLAVIANSKKFINVPVIYHTDHIKGPQTISILEAAIRGIPFQFHDYATTLRASTISLDASSFTHEETIQHIKHLCDFADTNNVTVTLEMEDAVDEGITSDEVAELLLGSIEEQFPGRIFLWAPGTGTKHGFGDNMHFSPKTIEKHIQLTKQITGREIGIALHGSTGLRNHDLAEASKAGVIKVNWSTESLLIRSTAAREYYNVMSDKLEKTHKEWKNTVMDNGVQRYVSAAYIPKVQERMLILGGEGQAGAAMKIIGAHQAPF
jgi:fructose-bisphosphate aldolase class II